MNSRKNLCLAAFALLHLLIFLIIFKSGIYRGFTENDISIPYLYASKIALGQIPYRDFPVEYPPLALFFMLIPRLFSPFASSYILGFTLEILLFDLLAMLLIAAFAQKLGMSLWKSLAVYTLAVLSIGPLIINRYDLIPAVMVLAALYAFSRGRSVVAWGLLAAGAMTKVFPVVIAPIFLIFELVHRRYRRVLAGISTFVLTAGIIALPFLILSPRGFLESFTYQSQRGLQIESVLASLLLLGQKLGLTTLSIEHASGGTNVVSPLANSLANITPALVLLLLAAVYWLYYRREKYSCHSESARLRRDEESQGWEATIAPVQWGDVDAATKPQTACLIGFSLLAVLAFILSDKVLSPQFIIWCLPLIPLVTGRFSRLSWLLFITAGLLSYLVFPTGYQSLEDGDIRMIVILLARNAALFGLAVAVASSACDREAILRPKPG